MREASHNPTSSGMTLSIAEVSVRVVNPQLEVEEQEYQKLVRDGFLAVGLDATATELAPAGGGNGSLSDEEEFLLNSRERLTCDAHAAETPPYASLAPRGEGLARRPRLLADAQEYPPILSLPSLLAVGSSQEFGAIFCTSSRGLHHSVQCERGISYGQQ